MATYFETRANQIGAIRRQLTGLGLSVSFPSLKFLTRRGVQVCQKVADEVHEVLWDDWDSVDGLVAGILRELEPARGLLTVGRIDETAVQYMLDNKFTDSEEEEAEDPSPLKDWFIGRLAEISPDKLYRG